MHLNSSPGGIPDGITRRDNLLSRHQRHEEASPDYVVLPAYRHTIDHHSLYRAHQKLLHF